MLQPFGGRGRHIRGQEGNYSSFSSLEYHKMGNNWISAAGPRENAGPNPRVILLWLPLAFCGPFFLPPHSPRFIPERRRLSKDTVYNSESAAMSKRSDCGVAYLLQLPACLFSLGVKSLSWSIRPKKRSEVVFATVPLEFNWTSGQDPLLFILSLVGDAQC